MDCSKYERRKRMKELNDDILKDYLLGKCTEEQAAQILEWMSQSEDNAQRLFKMEELYHLGRFSVYDDKSRMEDAEKRLMNRISAIETSEEVEKSTEHRSFRISSLLKYAAIAVIVLLVGIAGYWTFDHFNGSKEELVVAQATTGVKNIVLPDGTKVWLNKHASIKYPKQFNGDERNVELNGEAYFEVTKNPHQPFIVSSRLLDVKVLGTTFDFNTQKGDNLAEVSLIEGKVQATGNNNEGSIIITPGQKVVLNAKSHQIEAQRVNADLEAVWHNGMIPLRNVNVKDIAAILSRFYDVDFSFDAHVDMNMTYSGAIKQSNSIDSVLSALTYTVPLKYSISGRHVYLKNKD